jgi:hypothetical protein
MVPQSCAALPAIRILDDDTWALAAAAARIEAATDVNRLGAKKSRTRGEPFLGQGQVGSDLVGPEGTPEDIRAFVR